jgi:hypothetical protein
MKFRFFVLMLLSVTSLPKLFSQEIKWESKKFDFGVINKGDETNSTREIKFLNIGDKPLIFISCTHGPYITSFYPTSQIMPGEKGTIKIHYDVNRIGSFTKVVTINTNSITPKEILTAVGDVIDK